jgi:hypothetical protein
VTSAVDAAHAIAFTPPAGWSHALVSQPELGAGANISVEIWDAWQPPGNDDQRVVSGCLGTDLRTWTPEAAPIALERLDAVVSATLTRLDLPPALRVTRELRGDVTEEWLAGDGDAHGSARTFLGFTSRDGEPHLLGCFVLCAPASVACDDAIEHATPTSAFVPPPAASLPLRAVVLGVHHSRAVALGATALFVLAGALAIWTRPRPRRK